MVTITPAGKGLSTSFSSDARLAQAPKTSKGSKAGKVSVPKGPKASSRAPHPSSSSSANSDPLYDPSQILSGQNLKNAASGIANAQTAGPISELAKQIAQNNATSSATQQQDFAYYQQMAKDAQAQVAAEQGVATGLNSTLQGIGQQSQTQLAALGQQAAGGAVGRMGALGLDGGAVAQAASTAAQQQGVGAQNSATFQQSGATMGASNVGQAMNQAGSEALQSTQNIGRAAQAGQVANEPLNAKIAALQASNGALTSNALGQLRTQERNYQVAQAGLGIKAGTLAATQQNNQANQGIKIRGQNVNQSIANQRNATTQRGQNITQQNDLANQANRTAQLQQKAGNDAATQAWHQAALLAKTGQGATKPLSLVQNNKILSTLDEVIGGIQHLQQNGLRDKKGNVTIQHPSAGQIKSLLSTGYNATILEAAFELLGYGSINQQTAQNMRQMGIRGGTFRGAPIKVTPNYKAPSPKINIPGLGPATIPSL